MDLYRDGFTAANALELAGSYDVVVDATDNAASRYLISDACAVLNKPLVSGAALGTDGQLTVYCSGPDGARTHAPVDGACALCAIPCYTVRVNPVCVWYMLKPQNATGVSAPPACLLALTRQLCTPIIKGSKTAIA